MSAAMVAVARLQVVRERREEKARMAEALKCRGSLYPNAIASSAWLAKGDKTKLDLDVEHSWFPTSESEGDFMYRSCLYKVPLSVRVWVKTRKQTRNMGKMSNRVEKVSQ